MNYYTTSWFGAIDGDGHGNGQFGYDGSGTGDGIVPYGTSSVDLRTEIYEGSGTAGGFNCTNGFNSMSGALRRKGNPYEVVDSITLLSKIKIPSEKTEAGEM